MGNGSSSDQAHPILKSQEQSTWFPETCIDQVWRSSLTSLSREGPNFARLAGCSSCRRFSRLKTLGAKLHGPNIVGVRDGQPPRILDPPKSTPSGRARWAWKRAKRSSGSEGHRSSEFGFVRRDSTPPVARRRRVARPGRSSGRYGDTARIP